MGEKIGTDSASGGGPLRGQAALSARLDALISQAELGGPDAASAARRAAGMADGRDPERVRRALKLASRLDPLDAAPRLALSRVLAEQSDIKGARREAQAVLDEGVDEAARARAAFMLGEYSRAEGDGAAARSAYLDAVRIESQLLSADPQDPDAARWFARAKGRIAELDAAKGDWSEAKKGAEAAHAIFRAAATQLGESPMLSADIADAAMRRAAFALETEDYTEARTMIGEAIGRYEALSSLERPETHWRVMLGEAWTLAAEAEMAAYAYPNARQAIDKALAMRAQVARSDPHERWMLAGVLRLRAGMLGIMGDGDEARSSLRKAMEMCSILCAEAPHDAGGARYHLQVLLELAALEFRLGDWNASDAAAKAAAQRAEALNLSEEQASAWDRRAAVAEKLGKRDEAGAAAARALDLRRAIAQANPDSDLAKRGLCAALARAGETAMLAGDHVQANAMLRENFELRLALAEGHPGAREPARDLALGLEQLGRAAAARGDTAGARAAWEEELALAQRVFGDDDEGGRFCAIIESLIASLGGPDAPSRRASALKRLDLLAEHGGLTERDAALRKQLWQT